MPKNALAPTSANNLIGLAPYGMRYGGESAPSDLVLPKGKGFMGAIPTASGDKMTELSSAFDYNGKLISHPLIVPTLTKDELNVLKNLKDDEQIPESIYRKAQAFAISRLERGLNPFAGPTELRYPQPQD